MTIDPQLAEQVVAVALERLHAEGSVRPDTDHVVIDDPVVTGELLEQKLGSSRQVELAPGSILTPTARDVVARLGVACQWRGPSRPQESTAGWCLLLSGTVMVGQRIPSFWSVERIDTDTTVVARAVARIGTTGVQGVLVFSTRPHQVACLANRNQHVRAAVIRSLSEARQVWQEFGANLLVLSPSEAGALETGRVLQLYVETAVELAPADWTETTD